MPLNSAGGIMLWRAWRIRASKDCCSANHILKAGSSRACSKASEKKGSLASSPPGRYACNINFACSLSIFSLFLLIGVKGHNVYSFPMDTNFDLASQDLLGSRETGHYGAEGQTEHFGNLFVTLLIKVKKNHDGTVVFFHLAQGFNYFLLFDGASCKRILSFVGQLHRDIIERNGILVLAKRADEEPMEGGKEPMFDLRG